MHMKLTSSIASIALFLGASFASAEEVATETPQEGLQAIVDLYKSQDWEGLVKERCLDTNVANSDEAKTELVSNLSAQFSDTETLDALVTSYEAALSADPSLESEGTVAIFASEVGSVKLSKMENGSWGLRF